MSSTASRWSCDVRLTSSMSKARLSSRGLDVENNGCKTARQKGECLSCAPPSGSEQSNRSRQRDSSENETKGPNELANPTLPCRPCPCRPPAARPFRAWPRDPWRTATGPRLKNREDQIQTKSTAMVLREKLQLDIECAARRRHGRDWTIKGTRQVTSQHLPQVRLKRERHKDARPSSSLSLPLRRGLSPPAALDLAAAPAAPAPAPAPEAAADLGLLASDLAAPASTPEQGRSQQAWQKRR